MLFWLQLISKYRYRLQKRVQTSWATLSVLALFKHCQEWALGRQVLSWSCTGSASCLPLGTCASLGRTRLVHGVSISAPHEGNRWQPTPDLPQDGKWETHICFAALLAKAAAVLINSLKLRAQQVLPITMKLLKELKGLMFWFYRLWCSTARTCHSPITSCSQMWAASPRLMQGQPHISTFRSAAAVKSVLLILMNPNSRPSLLSQCIYF